MQIHNSNNKENTMDEINITTQLTLNDYLKANYYLLYRTAYLKFIAFLGILWFVIPIITYREGTSFNYMSFTFGVVIMLIPVFSYFKLKKNYYNTRIHETITYSINDETIHSKGLTFDSTFTWNKIYKVSETKTWILIWQTKYIAHIIPKRDFTPEQLNSLKGIVNKHKEVKNKMKKQS